MISRLALIRAANLDDMEPRLERWGMFTVDRRKHDVVGFSPDGRKIVVSEKSLGFPAAIGPL